MSNISVNFDYGDNFNTRADHNGVITININQVQQIINQTSGENAINVIRLIVGHEFAHEVEYYFRKTNLQTSLVKECQADILTGIFFATIKSDYMMKNINGRAITLQNFSQRISPMNDFWVLMAQSCDLFFKLGDDYSVENSHPRNEQRLTALRMGFYFGGNSSILKMAELVTTPDLKLLLRKAGSVGLRILDYSDDSNFMNWSLRTAQAITHTPISVNKNICVFTSVKRVDSTATSGYFHYQHILKNTGKYPVNILFYDHVFLIDGDSLSDSRRWQDNNMAKYEKTLQPGATVTIYGRLKYAFINYQTDLKPIFVKPGDQDALYYCTEPGVVYESENDIENPIISQTHEPSKTNSYETLISSRDQFPTYIAGIGRCPKSDLDVIYYPCKCAIPGSKETLIVHEVSTNKWALEVNIYEGIDQLQARSAVNDLRTTLNEIDTNITFERITGSPGFGYWNVYGGGHKLIGKVMLKENPAENNYNTVLTIFGVPK